MKYVVSDRCITCNTCVFICVTGAIAPGKLYYEIDQERCIACGLCREKCPAAAIDGIDGESEAISE